jgi:hypothetical protein
MKLRALAALVATGTTLLCTSPAHAVEPAELKQDFSVAGLVGFGLDGYYGLALGVRGGYTLPNNIYLGGTFIFNTGLGGWGAGFITGFEGGYQFAAGPVVVRPYGGIGVALQQYPYGFGYGNQYNAEQCALYGGVYCQYGGGTTTSLAFWFGGTAIYDFKGGPWFVAADIRFGDAPALLGDQIIFVFMPGGGYEF